jgi:hypothetical protein
MNFSELAAKQQLILPYLLTSVGWWAFSCFFAIILAKIGVEQYLVAFSQLIAGGWWKA